MSHTKGTSNKPSVAIIGIAGRFPGASDKEEFWRNQKNCESYFSEVPADRWDWKDVFGDPVRQPNKSNSNWGTFLDDFDQFDPRYFGLSPAEADVMDPQHRLFLKASCEAFWDAGYRLDAYGGKPVGVFAGVQFQEYQQCLIDAGILSARVCTGNAQTMLANRVSHLFDLAGPSLTIDTSCSSSLVALQQAVGAIRSGACEMAIAGGANMMFVPDVHIMGSQLGVLSASGVCRPFDAKADGYVRGEGVAAILLKPLSQALVDRDNIYAVIEGAAVNHTGRGSSITSPRSEAQADVMEQALKDAAVDSHEISYVEMHCTGTVVGDPIEFSAVNSALGTGQRPCGLGSIKSNIGHLEAASGIAGVINVAMALQNNWLPGMRSFNNLNQNITTEGTRFNIQSIGNAWDREDKNTLRKAIVNSFGFGGTNASVVLSDPPQMKDLAEEKGTFYVPLSVADYTHFHAYARKLATRIIALLDPRTDGNIKLSDIALTLALGRNDLAHRCVVRADSVDQLLDVLKQIKLEDISSPNLLLSDTVADNTWPDHARRWVSGDVSEWPDAPAARRISLPFSPWNDTRHWYSPIPRAQSDSIETDSKEPSTNFAYLIPQWRETEAAARVRRPAASNVMIVGAQSAQIDDLKGKLVRDDPSVFVDCIEAHSGTTAADVLGTLNGSRKSYGAIFIVPSAEAAANSFLGLKFLFELTQTLIRGTLRAPVRLIYVAPPKYTKPQIAAFGAFGKSAYLENENLLLSLVQVDRETEVAWIDQVADEWLSYQCGIPQVVSIEQNKRLHEELIVDQNYITLQTGTPGAFKDGGTYFVPGGMGELGKRLIPEVLRLYAAKVVVTGRSALDANLERQIAKMQEDVKFGAELTYDVCDIEDLASVSASIEGTKKRHGRIDGVISLVTAHRDALIFRKSWEDFEAVAASKTKGTENLDLATRDLNLDFFCLFSSQASLGIAGGSDYAYGCGFQNQFAHWRNTQVKAGHRSGRTITINWSRWIWDKYVTKDFDDWVTSLGYVFIDEKLGLQSLEKMLRAENPSVFALYGDPAKTVASIDLSTALLSSDASGQRWKRDEAPKTTEIRALLDGLDDQSLEALALKLGISEAAPTELHAPVADHSDTASLLESVRASFQEILKIDRIGEDEDLTDLGVDSIIAIDVVSRLEAELGVQIDLTWLFTYPTVRLLADQIQSQTVNSQGEETV